MKLEQENKPLSLDDIQREIYKNTDDIAVSIARSLERLEERIDAMEARLYSCIHDSVDEIEDRIEATRQEIFDKQFEITKYFSEKKN